MARTGSLRGPSGKAWKVMGKSPESASSGEMTVTGMWAVCPGAAWAKLKDRLDGPALELVGR